LLTDLGVLAIPRLFQPALALMPIVVAIVVIGDFLGIYRLKQQLSFSLSQTNHELAQTNTELAQALVAAQESTRIKSEFLANVSHELRTPLNSIINVPAGLLDEFEQGRIATCASCGAIFEIDADARLSADASCSNCNKSATLREETSFVYRGNPK